MKAVTTILLTLATLGLAAPNPNANTNANPAVLSTRQADCTYSCRCVNEDPAISLAYLDKCCIGYKDDVKKVCIPYERFDAVGFAECCLNHRYQCQASDPSCPPIEIMEDPR
ncbi:hypothetical protein B0I37DRAFT_79679 [Chaetomium sp. MPI-CAGE-AT-0009]|nr:hypothetical protein B0I37DRAFT_79679 [Chaetomium sp. MPI-CAGE-AT-0009]